MRSMKIQVGLFQATDMLGGESAVVEHDRLVWI